MANSDYRDGISDDGQGTLTELLEEIAPKVPGAVSGYITKELTIAAREYFRLSQAWQEFLSLPTLTESLMPYNLNPVDDTNKKVYAVLGLSRDGIQFHRGAVNNFTAANIAFNNTSYYCSPPTTINFTFPIPDDKPLDNVIAQVSYVPLVKGTDMPQWIIDNHREGIIATTLSRLFREIDKPYTSKVDAMYYGNLSRYHIAEAKTLQQKNYGNGEHQWMYPRGTR